MAVEAQRLPVEALADAAGQVAASGDLRAALAAIAAAAAEAVAAELVVVRVLDEDGELVARAVAPEGSALAAEVAGTRTACERIARGELSEAAARAGERARAAGTLVQPAHAGGRLVGAVEAVRADAFEPADEAMLALAAAQVALAVRTLAPGVHTTMEFRRAAWLDLAGEALAAGGDARRTAQQTVRIAADATGARCGVLWRVDRDGAVERLSSIGEVDPLVPRATALVREALETWRPAAVDRDGALPVTHAHVATLPLGQPPFAALQLFYGEDAAPADADLAGLAAFAARAPHALRSGERARSVELELERTRALLEVVSEAISRFSLAPTLETAVERIAEL